MLRDIEKQGCGERHVACEHGYARYKFTISISNKCANQRTYNSWYNKKMPHSLGDSIGKYNEDEKKHKLQVLQEFWTSVVEPLIFQRPNMIDLPIRDSIAIIHDNVKRSRMGHKKKRVSSEIGEGIIPRPLLKWPSHMLVSHLK